MATNGNERVADYSIGGADFMESDVLKRALERIMAMPEGEEKERAKKVLSQDYPGLSEILGVELSDAEAMMNTAMPEGRQAGQVYVAANPLEHLSAALRQGMGAYQGKQARDALRQLSADKGEGLRNTMFPGDGGEAQPQVQPQPQFQTQAQKPDYSQYGYGDPLINAGATILSGRDVPQQIQNANERRAKKAEVGLPVGERGTGLVGQLKQAAGINPRAEALRAMGGMGKPDLSRYGAPDINAGMGQQTERPPAIPFGAGVRPDQLTEQKQSLAGMAMENLGDSDSNIPPSMSEDRKKMLWELMNRKNLRGY